MTSASTLRLDVIRIINGWLGAVRGDARHAEILRLYNSFASGYVMQVNDAYCAATVSAAYIKAGIASFTGVECSVQRFIDLAKAKGFWVEDDAYRPALGDACCYDWDDKGSGDCSGWADHIGIVTGIRDNAFVVTEGNMSGGVVGQRTVAYDGRYIRGFIAPDFNAIAKALNDASDAEAPDLDGSAAAAAQALVIGQFVQIRNGASDYDGIPLASFVFNDRYQVLEVRGDRVVIGQNGVVTAALHVRNLVPLKGGDSP